ncbi:NIPA-like protein [Nymphaea thermarum]|nr:NIPA-like protein [Nymphaea thermarum]
MFLLVIKNLSLKRRSETGSCTGIPSSSGSRQGGLQPSTSEVYQRTPTGQRRSNAATVPICRPWDRGDLTRRLATFKSITWFAKPKVVSPANCARRGWINVEADTLECEACGSRLLFSTPSSWTSQQVENSAAVFSLKLDSGHKSICPWKDNICDEHLTQFPPTPPAVLVESFRDRCEKLSHLSALPIVSSAAIEYMNGPQLDCFLAQSSPPVCTIISGDVISTLQSRDLEDESASASAAIYHKAQKIISLCGWDLRVLSYIVDCQDQTRCAEDVSVSEISGKASQEQSPSIPFISGVDKVTEQDESSSTVDEQEVDPASVVLECKLCGACVGLWAFSTVSRPLHLFSFIESPDTTVGCNKSRVSVVPEASVVVGGGGGRGSLQTSANTVATSFKEALQEKGALSLNLTIAGGPPPAKQNFRTTVSLPIISRHLKAGIWCSSDTRKDIPVHSKQHSEDPGLSDANKSANTQAGDVLVETVGILKRKRADDGTTIYNDGLLRGPVILGQDPSKMENNSGTCTTVHAVEGFCSEQTTEPVEDVLEYSGNGEAMDSAAYDASGTPKKARLSSQVSECCDSTQDNSTDKDGQIGGFLVEEFIDAPNQIDDATPTATELCYGMVSAENKFTTDTSHYLLSSSFSEDSAVDKKCELEQATLSDGKVTSIRNEDADLQNLPAAIAFKKANVNSHSSGKIAEVIPWDKTMEFDPIRQHRHFCPWITSSGSGKRGLAGWQLTLSALEEEKNAACESSPVVSTGPRYEGEDPISVIRKLFHSGSAKRHRNHK